MQSQLLVAVLLLISASSSYQLQVDNLDDILVYPLEAPKNIRKREVISKETDAAHDAFVEEKLIQHSQALEELLRMVSSNSKVTEQLIEHLSTRVEKPPMPMPEVGKVIDHTRRLNSNDVQNDSLLSRLGAKIPLYGNFARNLARRHFSSDSEPQFTRRSENGQLVSVPSIKPMTQSPWCRLSILCHRKMDPVCAFDDNFGYGRFYDLCHMFQVNCYWKYNFSLVKKCTPNVH